MRIIAGRFKGRRLMSPPSSVRPTTDRVRESLFAVLGRPPDGALGVDLFCGVGSLGLEALSRGLERCIFVDRSPASLSALSRNLKALDLAAPSAEIRRSDARRFVEKNWPCEPVHWVFLDPPYDGTAGFDCLAALGRLDASQIGVVAYEGPPLTITAPGSLPRERVLDFGDTRITLLRGGLGT